MQPWLKIGSGIWMRLLISFTKVCISLKNWKILFHSLTLLCLCNVIDIATSYVLRKSLTYSDWSWMSSISKHISGKPTNGDISWCWTGWGRHSKCMVANTVDTWGRHDHSCATTTTRHGVSIEDGIEWCWAINQGVIRYAERVLYYVDSVII